MPKFFLIFSWVLLSSIVTKAQKRLFFSSFSPETWEIYLSKDEGKSFFPLTDQPALDYDAKISPDEKWVVFTSERSGVPQLYVLPIDGGAEARRLVQSDSFQDQVAFSPDGNQIAFVASHEGNADIYLLDFFPDSTQHIAHAKNLTNHPGGDFRPSFSPDGRYLAFSSDRGHAIQPHPVFPFAMFRIGDLYRLDLEQDELIRLTEEAYWDGSPIWSEDGEKIYFYSARKNNQPAVFKMNHDGTDVQQVSDSGHLGISPSLVSSAKIAYTTLDEPADRIHNLTLDLETGALDTLYRGELDLFNLHGTKSGLWVAHGAKTAREVESNLGGFAGNLIGAGFPRIFDQDSMNLELIAVRRGFVAPPDPTGPYLVYEYLDLNDPVNSFFEASTPWFWPALGLLLLGIFMVFRGIFLGIHNRKKVKIWKFLLASLVLLVTLILVLGIFVNFFFIDLPSFDHLLPVALIVAVILGILASWAYFKKSTLQKQQSLRSKLFGFLFIGFAPMSVLMGYLGIFGANLFQVQADLIRVNYQTLETEKIHVFEPNYGVHPAFSTVIDLKYLADGSGLSFTTGIFRGEKNSKGTIWQYDFEQKTQSKLTDSDWNNGFGDLSLSKETFVYRSDREGNNDIYVQENGKILNLTSSPNRENFPVISPDGNKIVFVGDQNGKDVGKGIKTMDLYLIQREGEGWSAPEQLTFMQSQTGHPHFSPDGEWIIYTTEEYGINDEQPLSQSFMFSPQPYGEIVALRLRDRKKVKLTHNKWEEGAPLWVRGLED
ncbi:hypothetical protein [Algoriphagus sp. CAU 1675]|uniref:TolB family protein n=1 Tax=Algoriphagus sp. CAU 1675 TaxID=3032597 RepID=UPI0023DB5D1E|nr:hypothetical protein [Algoriphagus sp. CAU 1675]MDF2156477.1 hypothetical protein [Algoriphagus sp. CAU 1675]